MSIVVSGSSDILSSSEFSRFSSKSSGKSFSVTQEFVTAVTPRVALFGQRNDPDWSLEQQKLVSNDDSPQYPGHGP